MPCVERRAITCLKNRLRLAMALPCQVLSIAWLPDVLAVTHDDFAT